MGKPLGQSDPTCVKRLKLSPATYRCSQGRIDHMPRLWIWLVAAILGWLALYGVFELVLESLAGLPDRPLG